MKLDVQVQGKNVAQLFRERDEYVLKYNADAEPCDFVSLTMPVRETPWKWPRDLHPFFRQNLPEGYLLNVIREEFGPHLDGTDLSLLAVIGGMGIGRVTVTPEGGAPGTELAPLQVEDLLTGQNTTEYFATLVRKYARAAISGAVPKFIAPEISGSTSNAQLGKSTIRTSRHIIKGSDDNTAFLGFNEFYTMRVLIVDRFDVDENGVPMCGLEDACGLLGLPPHEKYNATTERVLNATRPYLSGSVDRAQMLQFGGLLLTNYVVRNADCHAKNVALYYTSLSDVAYTPAYDIVTTQAYPRYASNPPGLSIDGRKTWAIGKSLERFFNTRLGIAPREYAEMVERLCESAVAVSHEIVEAANNERQWHGIAKQMLHAWHEGMTSIRSSTRVIQFQSLGPIIEAAGFSNPEPPELARKVLGRSEMLAEPRKRS